MHDSVQDAIDTGGRGGAGRDSPCFRLFVRGGRRGAHRISDASCQRFLDVLNGEAASAVVGQIFNWKGDIWAGSSTVVVRVGSVVVDLQKLNVRGAQAEFPLDLVKKQVDKLSAAQRG